MIAYQLIQEYPGLPDDIFKDNIVYYEPSEGKFYKNFKAFTSREGINRNIPKKFPNLWKELPLDFEILSFQRNDSKAVYTRESSGKYVRTDNRRDNITLSSAMDNPSYYNIHQALNKQTGKSLKIGDTITSVHTGNTPLTLQRFIFKSLNPTESTFSKWSIPRLVVKTNWEHENPNGQPFFDISPCKGLFVTEDNVEINLGDSYYYVKKDDLSIVTAMNALEAPTHKDVVYFANLKNAQRYVKQNKKLFSYNEIKTIYQDAGKRLYSFMDKIEEITHHRTK